MLNANQLSNLIIKPALRDLNLFTEEATTLLLFTCAVESNGGSYVAQENGPALGIYQMEPNTYADIWQNFIMNKSDIKLQLVHNFEAFRMPSEERLIYDLRFATAMARIHYARVKEPIPNPADIGQIYRYYKTYYNTTLGAATLEKCLALYNAFIG